MKAPGGAAILVVAILAAGGSARAQPAGRDGPRLAAEEGARHQALAEKAKEGTEERALHVEKSFLARIGILDRLADARRAGAGAELDDLVRRQLRRAGADATSLGSAFANRASDTTDAGLRDRLFRRALFDYRQAAIAWSVVAGHNMGKEAAEGRLWLADARYKVAVITYTLDEPLSRGEAAAARMAAEDARDAPGIERELRTAAARFIVDLAQQALSAQYRLFEQTNGAQGIERRDMVKTTQEGDVVKLVIDPLPPLVLAAIKTRDDYVRLISPEADPENIRELFAFQSADFYFLYGHFAEARRRLAPMFEASCSPDGMGYRAWLRLVSIAQVEGEVAVARALVEERDRRGCAPAPRNDPWFRDWHDVSDAYREFAAARGMPPGPEQDNRWRSAAALYRQSLEKDPARDEAPEVAIIGAYAFKRVGDYAAAIALYRLFLAEYAREDRLALLQLGDPNAKPPKPPDPKRYSERVRFAKQAWDALQGAQVMSFDYRGAAETNESITANTRFSRSDRLNAALNSLILRTTLGDPDRAGAAREVAVSLGTTPEKRAEIDLLFAGFELKRWDPRAPAVGANRAARLDAVAAMDRFLATYGPRKGIDWFLASAALEGARLRRAVGDPAARSYCRRGLGSVERAKAAKLAGQVADELVAACTEKHEKRAPRTAGLYVDRAPELSMPVPVAP